MLIAMCLLIGIMPVRVRAAGEERVIDIVYDNSGSMAFNDTDRLDSPDNYITRWVDADYAVRAFSALMEDEDKLYLFPMDKNKEAAIGQPQENVHFYEISGPDDTDIDKASESLGNTYYAGVENALKHLGGRSGERWIIILTDSENKDIWERTLNEVLRGVDEIGILYIPIAESPERLSLNESVRDKVTQIEPGNSGNIFSQILEATDYIYRRNSLTLSQAQGTVEFQIDAPVKELIVLMQAEGDTVHFLDRGAVSVNQGLKEKMAELERETGRDTGLVTRRKRSFQSYSSSTEPAYGSNADFARNLQIKDIQGEMIAFGGKSTIHEGSIYQKTISVRADESVNVYYQLDLGIELELWQDGKKAEGGEILEGDYEAVVYPINPDSGERVASGAQMLNGLTVKVNGSNVRFGETISFHAVYPQTIGIEVSVEGAALEEALSLSKSCQVKERIYPLAIQVLHEPASFSYDKMNRESIGSGEADAVHIKLSEDTGGARTGLRDSTAAKLKLESRISYKGLRSSGTPRIAMEIVKVSGTEDEYLLYPYLTEEEDYTVYRDVTCRITAYRADNKEQSTAVRELVMPLKAEEAVLKAELEENRRYSRTELIAGGVAYELTCNGAEILEGELGKLSFHTLEGGNRFVNLSRTGGALQLMKRLGLGIYWLYNAKETVRIHSEITYMRRGVPCTAVLEGEILAVLAPLPFRIVLYAATLLCALFCFYLLFNTATGRCFSPFFFCTLYFNNDTELGIRLKPGKWQYFRQIAQPQKGMAFCLTQEQRERYGLECPKLILQKRRGGKYYLMNWTAFSRQDGYRINGKYIFRGNAVMTAPDQFEFTDSAGLWNTIVFKGNLTTGEDGKE